MIDKLKYWHDAALFLERARDEFYNRVIGHAKIIGREDGHPVYSLLIPALLSDAHRTSLVASSLCQMTGGRLPMLANIGVTDVCDARCEHCAFELTRQSREILSTEQLLSTFEACHQLGVATIALVGGEPLLRSDLVDILRRFDCRRTNLVSFTNGGRLAQRARTLVAAGLRRVYVSLEYPDAARHDAFTHKPGLFDDALHGIDSARRAGMLVGISVTIHGDTTAADIQQFFNLALHHGVVEIYLCREIDRNRPITGEPPTDEWAKLAHEANQKITYPFGVFYYPRFASSAGFGGCTAGATRLYVSPYGDVTGCDVLCRSFGNVREVSLARIWNQMVNSPGMGDVHGPCRFALDADEDRAPHRSRLFV